MKNIKHIGIAAVTAEGAALCYKTIVADADKLLGTRLHPEISLNNPPYNSIYNAQSQGDWDKVTSILVASISKLAGMGADFAIIPANSVHFVIDDIRKRSLIPVLNIVEVTANESKRRKFRKAGILGIGITMSKGLFKSAIENKGISYMVPDKKDQDNLNEIIFNEIVPGRVSNKSLGLIVKLINKLKVNGCDGIVLACTELPLVINKSNSPLPFIDTTRLLAQHALSVACGKISLKDRQEES